MTIPTSSTLIILFDGGFEYGDSGISRSCGGCKACTSQHGTTKFVILIDLQTLNKY
jgi:hypothetical protein